jgi:hypothetical protein
MNAISAIDRPEAEAEQQLGRDHQSATPPRPLALVTLTAGRCHRILRRHARPTSSRIFLARAEGQGATSGRDRGA